MIWSIVLHYRLGLVVLAVLFVLLLLPQRTEAQIIIDPPPVAPRPPLPDPLRIQEQQVEVVIDGALAQVHLTQLLVNDSPRVIEGIYVLPLPESAAIGDFQMTVNGEVVEGEILRQEEAQRTYEEIVRQRRDPALLAYLGHDLFQVNIFPIPAGESRKLELTYSQLLSMQDGLYQFRYPLQTRQLTNAPIDALTIRVELINQPGLRTIYSTSYAIETTRMSDSHALVSYETTNEHPDGDFVLYFGMNESAIGVNVLSYQPAGEDGYFALLAAPSVETSREALIQRDMIMVMDVSGSMQGEKMAQAIDAAHYVVNHLNPYDRFNLIAFSSGVRLWQSELQVVNGATVRAANEWIDTLSATGGTDINRALTEALAQFSPRENTNPIEGGPTAARPAYVLFMTDGLPTQGERDPREIIRNVLDRQSSLEGLRLFSFGVGYDVNTLLLDTLSGELGGRSSYVRPEERIDEIVSHFYTGISRPVLSDLAVEIGKQAGQGTGDIEDDVTVDELYPFPLPDLFAGEQIVIVGRYHTTQGAAESGPLPLTITLHGTVNGETIHFRYPDQPFVQQGGEPNVARLWAARKIGSLLQQIRLSGAEQELVDAVIDLGLRYGIVTPYTSAFVPDPAAQDSPATAVGGKNGASEDLAADLSPLATTALRDGLNNSATSPSAAGAVSERMAQTVGAEAVMVSEQIEALETADVAQNGGIAKFVAGRRFFPTSIGQAAQNYPLTRWIDSRYNETMVLQPVLFGSACYFDLWKLPTLAEWLSVAPELIVVVDEAHALLITTELEATQAQLCPTIDGIK